MLSIQPETLSSGLSLMGLNASADKVEKLVHFAELLLKWNKTYNLTAIRRTEDILTHHLLDSAAIVPLFIQKAPKATSILDVGSGGGLPAIPLAVLRSDLNVFAVDAVAKKTAFLTQAGIALGLKNFHPLHARVETLKDRAFDVISSRAFASLSDFVSLTRHLLSPEGKWFAMKGVVPHEEIAELPADVRVEEIISLTVHGLNEERHLIILTRQ